MIEVEGLTKYYGSLPAILDLNFTVNKGEIVGFLGPNGAGKSTTIKILTCYMPPSSGYARINGWDCFKDSLKVRQTIGYLPEHVPLYKEMTVKRFLQFIATAKNLHAAFAKKEVQRVINLCGLEKVAHRIIGNLSKGYKQRVGFAQALIGNPPVLILDEPTIGLDPAQIVEIRNLIRSLGTEHTVLMSSHILPEVAQICNRVLIINKGRIVATDSPERLSRQLQKSSQVMFSIELPADENLLKKVLTNIEGVKDVFSSDGQGEKWIVETNKEKDIRPEIAEVIIKNGFKLLELKSVDATLEDVFMQLVTEEESLIAKEAV